MDTHSFHREFRGHAAGTLTSIGHYLDALENNNDNKHALSETHRAFHSLGGVAGFLKHSAIHGICRNLEKEYKLLLTGSTTLTATLIQKSRKAIDEIDALLIPLGETVVAA